MTPRDADSPIHELRFEAELLMDALYLHAARQAYSRACHATDRIRDAHAFWRELERKERSVLARFGGDEVAAYDKVERVSIQMEGADYRIGEAYAPLIKEAAAVHFLCCAALESHINSVAESELGG